MELKDLKQFVANHDNFEIRVITHSGTVFIRLSWKTLKASAIC